MTSAPSNLAAQLCDVRVGVRQELDVSRHVFAGEPAYVIHDLVSFQSHRLSQADYQVFSAIHDRQNLGSIFKSLVEADKVSHDQEEAFYKFVLSLTQRGMLVLPISNGGRLFQRYEEKLQAKKKGRLLSMLFLRVPLVRPDRFLSKTMHLAAPLFSRGALVAWIVCLAVSLMLASARWQELTSPLASLLTLGNLPVLWTLLVMLKVIHEFGHAYACKHFGGRVPEMGAYFILFTPCAYVDASASWGFPSRWHRILVALAGMYFESIAAMAALVLWAITPPGALHDAAHYAMVLSTAVTIAFNINPLMRYDGYYVLSDVVGIPNLRGLADRRLRHLAARILYGVRRELPGLGRRREVGLAAFALACAVYKILLLFGISLVIAQKLPLVGMGIAAWYVVHSVRQGGLSLVNYLRFSPDLEGCRRRAVGATLAVVGVAVLLVCLVPIPGAVESVGVVTRHKELTVRAGASGFFRQLLVENGELVEAHTPICRMENLDLEMETERLGVQEQALQVKWKQAVFHNREVVAAAKAQLDMLREQRKAAQTKRDALTVRTAQDGVVTDVDIVPIGTFLNKGDAIATVGSGSWTIRVLLTSEQMVDACPKPGDSVQYRLTGCPQIVWQGRIETVATQGQKKIEHHELTQLAGGNIAVDPQSYESSIRWFEINIHIPESAVQELRTGNIAQVQFQGPSTTMLKYLYRRGLQLVNDLLTLG